MIKDEVEEQILQNHQHVDGGSLHPRKKENSHRLHKFHLEEKKEPWKQRVKR